MNGRMMRLLRVHRFDKLERADNTIKGIYQEDRTDEAIDGVV